MKFEDVCGRCGDPIRRTYTFPGWVDSEDGYHCRPLPRRPLPEGISVYEMRTERGPVKHGTLRELNEAKVW